MKRLPEGGTLGDAFKTWRKQTGKPHPEDKPYVTAPEALLYLWGWFWEIAQGRPLGPEGVPLPIPNVEIRAWSELAGVRLVAWELAALRALDGTYLKVAAEKHV